MHINITKVAVEIELVELVVKILPIKIFNNEKYKRN